ncbi:hypothetical protein PM082_024734 [Marasmius tenuissimus]|nr:hypothetical protein PM082_024734 [Marasmius tenuissimus]
MGKKHRSKSNSDSSSEKATKSKSSKSRSSKSKAKTPGRRPGRQSWPKGEKLALLQGFEELFHKDSGSMYKQATAALIAKFGYDPPEAAPVEGKDYSVRDINTYEGQARIDEEEERQRYKQKLHKQITNWAQYHWARKKVDMDGVTQLFLGVLDVAGSAPRKPQERQYYMRQHYNDRFKADFDTHWNALVSLGTVESEDRIKELNRYCEARWDEETDEFKDQLREELEMQHKQDLADHRDRGSWTADAESYARMWRRAKHILPPVVVSTAKLMGVGATLLLWGPRADGEIRVDSCQVPGSSTKKDLSEFDPVAFSAMHKACQDYANAVFPPSLCQSRVVEGGVGEMESTPDTDGHAGHLFRSAADGTPVVIDGDVGTATTLHSNSSTTTPTTNLNPAGGLNTPSHSAQPTSSLSGNLAGLPPPVPSTTISSDGSTPPVVQAPLGPPTFFNNSGLELPGSRDDVWQAWPKTLPPEQLASLEMMNQNMNSELYQLMNGPGNSAGDMSAMGGLTFSDTNNGFAMGSTSTNTSVWASNRAPEATIGTTADASPANLPGTHEQFPSGLQTGGYGSWGTDAPAGFTGSQKVVEQGQSDGDSVGALVGINALKGTGTSPQAASAIKGTSTAYPAAFRPGIDTRGSTDRPLLDAQETLGPLPIEVQEPATNGKKNSAKRQALEQSTASTRTSKRRKAAEPDRSHVEGTKEIADIPVAQGRARHERRVPQHLRGGGKGSFIVSPTKSNDAEVEEGTKEKGTKTRRVTTTKKARK